MQHSVVIAIWDIRGETLPDMESEARSDALMFLGDTTGIDINVVHCVPISITDGRVNSWKGWAVASWGSVEPQLLSRIVMDHQSYRLQLQQGFYAQLSSQSQQ